MTKVYTKRRSCNIPKFYLILLLLLLYQLLLSTTTTTTSSSSSFSIPFGAVVTAAAASATTATQEETVVVDTEASYHDDDNDNDNDNDMMTETTTTNNNDNDEVEIKEVEIDSQGSTTLMTKEEDDNNDDDEEEEDDIIDDNDNNYNDCAIWLAKSSIPNSGLGMYAGKTLKQNDMLLPNVGDIVIPLIDLRYRTPIQYRRSYLMDRQQIDTTTISNDVATDDSTAELLLKEKLKKKNSIHQEYDQTTFLWDDYGWACNELYCDNEGYVEVDGLSNGFGACANTVLDLVNVDEALPIYSIPQNLHRTPTTTTTLSSSTLSTSSTLSSSNENEKEEELVVVSSSSSSSYPGIGAFTYYHSRKPTVKTKFLEIGQEIFVQYGNNWFIERNELFNFGIPINGSHKKATYLLQQYKKLKSKYIITTLKNKNNKQKNNNKVQKENEEESSASIMQSIIETDLWEQLILNDINTIWKSRILGAIPRPITTKEEDDDENDELDDEEENNDATDDDDDDDDDNYILPSTQKEIQKDIEKYGLITYKRTKLHRKSLKWLKQHGTCISNELIMKESTILNAGHGIFTSFTKTYKKGNIILPIPLLHIPDKNILTIQSLSKPFEYYKHQKQPIERIQLLLNYCFGHKNSTLLLSPYGPIFPLINHAPTISTTTTTTNLNLNLNSNSTNNNDENVVVKTANVKLQWANPKKSIHNPKLLNYPIWKLTNIKYASLAMELIAIRDIKPNEELLLDYGNDWEVAWKEHVTNFKLKQQQYHKEYDLNKIPPKVLKKYNKTFNNNNENVNNNNNNKEDEEYIYTSSYDMNKQVEIYNNKSIYYKLRTEFEQLTIPYPDNIEIKFNLAFLEPRHVWEKHIWENTLNEYLIALNRELVSCDILRYRKQLKPLHDKYTNTYHYNYNDPEYYIPKEHINDMDSLWYTIALEQGSDIHMDDSIFNFYKDDIKNNNHIEHVIEEDDDDDDNDDTENPPTDETNNNNNENSSKKKFKHMIIIHDLPREAFVFVDRPFTTDMFLPYAFRQPIGIPDDMFPDAWKNL